jgi:hypothetical protein
VITAQNSLTTLQRSNFPAIVLGDSMQLGSEAIVPAAPEPAGTPPPRWLPPVGQHAIVNIDATGH